jgi:hypothetical protein
LLPSHRRFWNYRDEATVPVKTEKEEVKMSERRISRCSLIAGAAMVLSFAATPVHAQGVPSGSYLRTCTHVDTRGDTLIADCRRTDGSWGRAALRDVNRCVGDIGNMDGQLSCNGGRRDFGRRDRSYGRSPGYGYDRYGEPGYGSSGGYWPPPGYPSDYGR